MEIKKLAIIDDDKIFQMIIKQQLKKIYQVEDIKSLFDGEEGINHIQELLSNGTLPDVILLDINMPDMDGYAVCQQLQSD